MNKGRGILDGRKLQGAQARLLTWYDAHKRQLPWRETRDPYRIWISEIMLQQTRVAAVLDHYRRFLERFPNVQALAEAKEADVLAAWSGLGYYRRARAMHAAAQKVVLEMGGAFPRTAAGLAELPGIGRYTAAAIASIAFGEPVAVVDGNVERVLSRVLAEDLRDRDVTWEHAERLLARDRPGDWNQAVMELGATICLPADPKCLTCPLRESCADPGRETKKQKPERKKRELRFRLAQRRGSVYLVRRAGTDKLMAGMWELPMWSESAGGEVVHRGRHSITTNDYAVSVLVAEAPELTGGKWVSCKRLPEFPLTGLTRKILRATNLWPSEGI